MGHVTSKLNMYFQVRGNCSLDAQSVTHCHRNPLAMATSAVLGLHAQLLGQLASKYDRRGMVEEHFVCRCARA